MKKIAGLQYCLLSQATRYFSFNKNNFSKENRLCFEEALPPPAAQTQADAPVQGAEQQQVESQAAPAEQPVVERAAVGAEPAAALKDTATAEQQAAPAAPAAPAEQPAAEREAPAETPAEAQAETPAETIKFTGKLDLYDLKDKLKTISIEASPEEIKKAFKYYDLDDKSKGYKDGYEYGKTKEILDGVKQLITEDKIKKEQLAYLGSVDGTHYVLGKILKKDEQWHKAKADALEILLAFISDNKVIFEPEDKKPDDATQTLIKDYIQKVNSNLDDAKQLIKDNETIFTEAQGILNMGLAVQRAHDIKARILGDTGTELDRTVDIIRLELGTESYQKADRKSGLLLKEQDNPIKPFRDDITYREETPKENKRDEESHQEGKESPKSESAPKKKKQKNKPNPAKEKESDEKPPVDKYYGELGLSDDKKTIIGTRLDKTTWKYGINNKTKYQLEVQGFTSKEYHPEYGEKAIIIYDGKKRLGFIYYNPKDTKMYGYYDTDNNGASKINITFDDSTRTCFISPVSGVDAQAEQWLEEKAVYYDYGKREKGQYSVDEHKFKGTTIYPDGQVTEGEQKLENSGWSYTKVTKERLPTQAECLENISYWAKGLGIKINLTKGQSYDFQHLWANTLNLINGIKQGSLAYMKENNLGIILNSNQKSLFQYNFEGLQTLSNGKDAISIDYWDDPADIAETINKAATKHKKKTHEDR